MIFLLNWSIRRRLNYILLWLKWSLFRKCCFLNFLIVFNWWILFDGRLIVFLLLKYLFRLISDLSWHLPLLLNFEIDNLDLGLRRIRIFNKELRIQVLIIQLFFHQLYISIILSLLQNFISYYISLIRHSNLCEIHKYII